MAHTHVGHSNLNWLFSTRPLYWSLLSPLLRSCIGFWIGQTCSSDVISLLIRGCVGAANQTQLHTLSWPGSSVTESNRHVALIKECNCLFIWARLYIIRAWRCQSWVWLVWSLVAFLVQRRNDYPPTEQRQNIRIVSSPSLCWVGGVRCLRKKVLKLTNLFLNLPLM